MSTNLPQTITVNNNSSSTDDVLKRIDFVLRENKAKEYCLLGSSVVLFLLGIGALIYFLYSKEHFWVIPPAITTHRLFTSKNPIADTPTIAIAARFNNSGVGMSGFLLTGIRLR